RPFIIVMTYGLTNEGQRPGARRGGPGSGGDTTNAVASNMASNAPARSGGRGGVGGLRAHAAFETGLCHELIPYIDANFRTPPDQPHRAMAGLSMGGGETHYITLKHLDLFSHIGLFSGGVISTNDVNDTPGFRQKVKVVFASCGSRENPGNV